MQETNLIVELAGYLLKLFGFNSNSGILAVFFLSAMLVFFIFVFIILLLFFANRRKGSDNRVIAVKSSRTGASGKTDAKNVFNNTIKR